MPPPQGLPWSLFQSTGISEEGSVLKSSQVPSTTSWYSKAVRTTHRVPSARRDRRGGAAAAVPLPLPVRSPESSSHLPLAVSRIPPEENSPQCQGWLYQRPGGAELASRRSLMSHSQHLSGGDFSRFSVGRHCRRALALAVAVPRSPAAGGSVHWGMGRLRLRIQPRHRLSREVPVASR